MPILTLSSTTPTATGSGAAGTISHVGTDRKSSFNSGVTVSTLTFTSINAGDMIHAIVGGGDGSASAVASALGSGGTTGWMQVLSPLFDSTFGGGPALWMGQVVTPGADTLNVTWSSHSHTTYLGISQYTSSVALANTVWTVDKVGTPTSGSGTTITWPSLTPTGTGELYYGISAEGGTPSAGATAGYTYNTDAATNEYCYNPSIGAATAPTCTQTSGTWQANGALMRAFAPAATVNSNTVTLQQVPAGRQWVISQIGYEILPVTTATNITVNVTMNQRALYSNVNGNGGANQGPPYIAVRPGDNLTVNWSNAPIGSSCIANFFYNEYDAYAQPSDIGGLV